MYPKIELSCSSKPKRRLGSPFKIKYFFSSVKEKKANNIKYSFLVYLGVLQPTMQP